MKMLLLFRIDLIVIFILLASVLTFTSSAGNPVSWPIVPLFDLMVILYAVPSVRPVTVALHVPFPYLSELFTPYSCCTLKEGLFSVIYGGMELYYLS